MHYYKFNISDWYSRTGFLSLEEEAVYFRLLNHYYDTETPLPIDTTKLYRRLKLTDYSEIADDMLSEFFELTNNGWEKEKCKEIIKVYQKNKKKNKRNGKKGGRPIGSKGSSTKPNGLINKTQSQPNGNPNQELLTTNQEPITKVIKTAPPAFNFKKEVLNLGVDNDTLTDWLTVRKKKRSANTKTAFNTLLREITKSGLHPQQAIEMAASQSWAGFKAEWVNKQTSSPQELNFDSLGWKQ